MQQEPESKFDVYPTCTVDINRMSVFNHPTYVINQVEKANKIAPEMDYVFDIVDVKRKHEILSDPNNLVNGERLQLENILNYHQDMGMPPQDADAMADFDLFDIDEEKRNTKDKPKNTHKNKPTPKMGMDNKKKKKQEPEITPFSTKPQ